jgi:hypothetical protein
MSGKYSGFCQLGEGSYMHVFSCQNLHLAYPTLDFPKVLSSFFFAVRKFARLVGKSNPTPAKQPYF